jgi:hypothetical protein
MYVHTRCLLDLVTAQHLILAEPQCLKSYHEKLYQMLRLPDVAIIQYYTIIEHVRFVHLTLFIYCLQHGFAVRKPLSGESMNYTGILQAFHINCTHIYINLHTWDVYSLDMYFDFHPKRSLH